MEHESDGSGHRLQQAIQIDQVKQEIKSQEKDDDAEPDHEREEMLAENVSFGPKMQGVPQGEIASRVRASLDMVKLTSKEGLFSASFMPMMMLSYAS